MNGVVNLQALEANLKLFRNLVWGAENFDFVMDDVQCATAFDARRFFRHRKNDRNGNAYARVG